MKKVILLVLVSLMAISLNAQITKRTITMLSSTLAGGAQLLKVSGGEVEPYIISLKSNNRYHPSVSFVVGETKEEALSMLKQIADLYKESSKGDSYDLGNVDNTTLIATRVLGTQAFKITTPGGLIYGYLFEQSVTKFIKELSGNE